MMIFRDVTSWLYPNLSSNSENCHDVLNNLRLVVLTNYPLVISPLSSYMHKNFIPLRVHRLIVVRIFVCTNVPNNRRAMPAVA
jgi:hypothetical protein